MGIYDSDSKSVASKAQASRVVCGRATGPALHLTMAAISTMVVKMKNTKVPCPLCLGHLKTDPSFRCEATTGMQRLSEACKHKSLNCMILPLS